MNNPQVSGRPPKLGPREARAAKRRLNTIMRQVAVLLEEMEELEAGLPVPSSEEWEEIRRGPQVVTYEVFFLGLVGLIGFHLAEAVATLWEGYSDWRPSKFPKRIPDGRFMEKVGFIVSHERWRARKGGLP